MKSKVDAVKLLNKRPDEMNVSQLKLLVTWFKQAGDLPVPTTRAALLERFNATIGRGDPIEPAIPSLVDQPPLLPRPPPEIMADERIIQSELDGGAE